MAHYILADNQELTRFAVESIIRADEKNTLTHASEKAQLLEQLRTHEEAVVILDYNLYDFPSENSLLATSERFPKATWLLLSEDLAPELMRKIAYSSKAFSLAFKDSPLHIIREALKYTTEGERYIDYHANNILFTRQEETADDRSLLLTSTETEIVKLIAQGKTTKDIAAERFSSIHTINTHRKNIFHKLGVNTAHDVMKYALKTGLLDASDLYYI